MASGLGIDRLPPLRPNRKIRHRYGTAANPPVPHHWKQVANHGKACEPVGERGGIERVGELDVQIEQKGEQQRAGEADDEHADEEPDPFDRSRQDRAKELADDRATDEREHEPEQDLEDSDVMNDRHFMPLVSVMKRVTEVTRLRNSNEPRIV